MTADGKVTLSLPPAPVVASVSWDDVRAYLRAEGWEQKPNDGDGGRRWGRPGDNERGWIVRYEPAPDDLRAKDMERGNVVLAIHMLAHLASVSPGEMLARIAGGAQPEQPDEWTERIHAAFPTRSGSHDEYATAMRMVGNRHAKGELVALVNWLLAENRRAAEDMRERCAKAVANYARGGADANDIATAIRALPVEPGKADGAVGGRPHNPRPPKALP